jgi:GNAT superfamily N-acetyltransferase
MRVRLTDVRFSDVPKKDLFRLSYPFGGMRSALSNPEEYRNARVVVARAPFSGQVLGWCLYRPIQEPTVKGISYDVMFWYYVDPAYRRRGIGKQLAARAHLRAKRWHKDIDRFAVSAFTTEGGRQFFRKTVPSYVILGAS